MPPLSEERLQEIADGDCVGVDICAMALEILDLREQLRLSIIDAANSEAESNDLRETLDRGRHAAAAFLATCSDDEIRNSFADLANFCDDADAALQEKPV
jgi:hypothetical protein